MITGSRRASWDVQNEERGTLSRSATVVRLAIVATGVRKRLSREASVAPAATVIARELHPEMTPRGFV